VRGRGSEGLDPPVVAVASKLSENVTVQPVPEIEHLLEAFLVVSSGPEPLIARFSSPHLFLGELKALFQVATSLFL